MKKLIDLKLSNRNIKIIVLIGLTIITVFFLNHKIETDISYHAGKDAGYFKRLESVIIFSVIFYILISKQKRILYGIIGFVISIISSFIGLYIFSSLPEILNEDIIIHLTVFGISYLSFFGIEKVIEESVIFNKNYN